MKNRYVCCYLVALLCLTVFQVSAQTVDDIISLAQKGIAEDVMLAAVERSATSFNLSAADILKLKDAKTPDKVIAAMLRHKGAAKESVAEQPKEIPPVIQPATPVIKKESRADGVLNIENVDDKVWSYSYEPEKRVIWFATPTADGRGNLNANSGVNVRLPAGKYKVRYNGQDSGPNVTIFKDEKSLILLSRVDRADIEALYVSIFERGERKANERLVVLRESEPARPLKKTSEVKVPENNLPTERVVERERIIEVPSTTVIYNPPVYTYPRYYVPAYPHYYYPASYYGVEYSHYHHHSGFSIGIGFGH